MKTKSLVLMLIAGVIMLRPFSTSAEPSSQVLPLPADLLFTTTNSEAGDYPRNVIARVDAETFEVSPFYVDAEADEIIPISWSPQGNLLAIYRTLPAINQAYTLFPQELCVLDRSGVLQQCFEDTPPMYFSRGPYWWQQYYPIVWGDDGQTIYFDTEYVNEISSYGYGKRLIEASVLTGETLRIVYEYPDPFPISPSPDLTHAVVGSGPWIGSEAPAYWVDLATDALLDIPSLVPNQTTLYMTCVPVSPNGNYITVSAEYKMATYAPDLDPASYFGSGYLLVILDKQGTIQGIVGQPDNDMPLFGLECPGWQPDEQAIVFLAYGLEQNYIMRYSLPDQQLTALYELGGESEQEAYAYSPLVFSPDNIHIALTVSDDPYGERAVAVLFPDDEIRRIPSPYRFGLYPLWVPPLEEELPGFEPLGACWVRDWNQAQTEWHIDNPNPVPLSTTPMIGGFGFTTSGVRATPNGKMRHCGE